MAYEIIHNYTGHWDIFSEHETLEEAVAYFDESVKTWGEVDPSSEYLELRYYDEESGDQVDEIRYHELTPSDTWQDNDSWQSDS